MHSQNMALNMFVDSLIVFSRMHGQSMFSILLCFQTQTKIIGLLQIHPYFQGETHLQRMSAQQLNWTMVALGSVVLACPCVQTAPMQQVLRFTACKC